VPAVLLVYSSEPTAEALARRVEPLGPAELVPAPQADDRLRDGGPYDVVVLCPSVGHERRAELERLISGAPSPPTTIALQDLTGGAIGADVSQGAATPPERVTALLLALIAAGD